MSLSSLRARPIQRDRVSRGARFTLTHFKQDVAIHTGARKENEAASTVPCDNQHRARDDRHSGGEEEEDRRSR